MKQILVIQTAFIGDVVLTTPMLAALKKTMPDSKVTVLVKPEASSILSDHDAVDEVLVIDKKNEHRFSGMLNLARIIREKQFDILLCPHKSHRSSILSMLSKIPVRYGYKESAFSFAFNRKLERPMDRPEIHRLLQFLKDSILPEINIGETSDIPNLFETEKSRMEATSLLEEVGATDPILLGCSSVWPTKRWTPYGFAELALKLQKKYRKKILLVGSKDDTEISNQVLHFVREMGADSTHTVVNVCGRTSLLGLYSLMRRSMLLVSNDSAPVHFACAAQIPVVALFGPTVPSLGYAPIAPETTVAEINLDCRPCGSHGSKKCPLEHFRCMRDMTADFVLEKVIEVVPER